MGQLVQPPCQHFPPLPSPVNLRASGAVAAAVGAAAAAAAAGATAAAAAAVASAEEDTSSVPADDKALGVTHFSFTGSFTTLGMFSVTAHNGSLGSERRGAELSGVAYAACWHGR